MAKQNVLFLCTGNSARSQMAEALLRSLGGDRFEAYSAGVEPKGLHPLAIQAMDEVGIDIRGQRSKGLGAYLGRLYVHQLITVCDDAAARCPTAWPNLNHREHWSVADPARAEGAETPRLEAFRAARDELRARIEAWLAAHPAVSKSAPTPRGA